MNDEGKIATLAEMAQRRVQSIRSQAAKDIALRLLEETGQVTQDQVQAALAEHPMPTPVQLLDQMAQKAAAAVEFYRRAVESAQQATSALDAKVETFERLLRQAKEDREAHDLDAEQAELAKAEAFLEFVLSVGGDPSKAPPSEIVSVVAGAASTVVKVRRTDGLV